MDSKNEIIIIDIGLEQNEFTEDFKTLINDSIKALFGDQVNLNSDQVCKKIELHLQSNFGNHLVHSEKFMFCSEKKNLYLDIYPIHKFEENSEKLDEETISAYNWTQLPSRQHFTSWNNLHYSTPIKEELLKFVMTYIKLSQKMLNSELFGLNKIILLHGPAGSGKTSLCCGLAQKAAAMLYNQYQDIYLIEINSQNLFSKWFSESGKLVSKLFSEMNEMLQNKDNMIFLLIDEVESLISSRIMSMNSNEPSDSIRVVNSVLMHIDRIKRHNNILILSTSNILEAIDNAFIDRVDLKLFVDHPAEPSINKILTNSIQQLVTNDILSLNNEIVDDEIKRLSKMCVGISGRKIKKLPFLSLSKCYTNNNSIQFSKFMEKSIEEAIKAKSINKNLNQKTTFNGLSPFST